MKLSAIEPSSTGQDLRTFTCPECRRVQRHIIETTVTEAWQARDDAGECRHLNVVIAIGDITPLRDGNAAPNDT